MLLSKEWPCGGSEVPTGWCQRSSSHHTECHYSAIWHYQCAGQYQYQETLHACSCLHRTSTWSPVASSIGTYSYSWATMSWFLKSTGLPAQLEAHAVEVPTKAMVGQVVPANQVPLVVHPTRTAKETNNQASKTWVLEALYLQSLNKWPESEQKQARELLLKWEHLFVHSDLDLGKTALIKHKIQLTDQMPFKESYWRIPPQRYDDVRDHIQEILDFGAIHKLHSLWASTVVLHLQWGHWGSMSAKECQCPCNLPETNGDLSWGPQSPLVYHLSEWHSHLLQGTGQSPQETRGSVLEIGGGRTQAFKMWVIPVAASLSGTCHFCPRSSHWWRQNQGYQELAHTHKCYGGPKFWGVHRILP